MYKNKQGLEKPNVTLFASAVRPLLWNSFLDSLKGTSCTYEVVFAGHCKREEVNPFLDKYSFFKYIHTGHIKPSQAYEVARRNSIGETILWTADDAESPNNVIGKAYDYWKSQNNEKLILSIQTKESGYGLPEGKLFNMNNHRFFGGQMNTPLMAPLALMSRNFLNNLGGIDRRYVCGQYENDLVMRAYTEGSKVEIFGSEDCFIDIDHLGKSIMIGESTTHRSFLRRPFAKGYEIDRSVLEKSWCKNGVVLPNQRRYDNFEPFENINILTESQSNNIPEMWI